MSITTTYVHKVTDISVSEVKQVGIYRWQNVEMKMADGSSHVISAFLLDDYPGFHFSTREPEPKRRVDDNPRQLSLDLGNGYD